MKRLILATAGHIDHGKTALVRALTGVDTDRLPEEKTRGITIDLGFAQLQLGNLSFGVVDVPGHEGFIRNMLAGATGMDVVLLVIAADEGVMPQTREHLAILELLAAQAGVVAITKCDLVSQEWLDLVIDDVEQLLSQTSLHGAPIIPVSSRNGSGLDALRAAIAAQADRPRRRNADDLFRLPIDRVFTVHGTGTVVTGTVWSGRVHNDQSVYLSPAIGTARIRGIQVHGKAVDSAVAGERAALALASTPKETIARGAVVLDASWPEASMLVVRAHVIPDTGWRLAPRQRVRVHLGTTETIARAVLLDSPALEAGKRGWIQLRLEQAVVARAGDRLVLRSYSPVTTIGGGVVGELSERKRTHITAEEAALFAAVVEGTPEQATAAALALRGLRGATAAELAIMTPYAPTENAKAIRGLGGQVVTIGTRHFSHDVVHAVEQSVLQHVQKLHALHPLRPAVERAEIVGGMRKVPADLVAHALDVAASRGELSVSGSSVAARGFNPVLSDRQASPKSALVEALKQGGIAPPTVAELGRNLGDVREVQRVLKLLEHEGLVRPVSQDLYIEVSALTAAQERTRATLVGAGSLSAAEFRTALPVTRKHLIPLLEYFDKTGITLRQGDLRTVIPASEEG